MLKQSVQCMHLRANVIALQNRLAVRCLAGESTAIDRRRPHRLTRICVAEHDQQ